MSEDKPNEELYRRVEEHLQELLEPELPEAVKEAGPLGTWLESWPMTSRARWARRSQSSGIAPG